MFEIENSSVEAVETDGLEVAAPEATEPTTETTETTETTQPEPPAEPEIPHRVWETARKRAESEAMRRVNAQFAERFGQFTNPATGKPVQSMEDYFAALDAQQQARTEQQLKDQGIDPELLNRAVQESPVVRQAQQLLAQQQANQAKQALDSQLQAITAMDPAVKGLEDIVKLPEFERFDQLVRTGMKLDDAYKLACFDRLALQRESAAKQATINAAKGKQHLLPTDGAGGENSRIPADERAKWKEWFPNKSEEQLEALYSRVHNKRGD